MGQQHDHDPASPDVQERDDQRWVLAFFPGGLLTGEPDADAWDLHRAAAWNSGAAHGGGMLSLRRGTDAAVDELVVWLQGPDVLGRPVNVELGRYWMTVDGDHRVFPLYWVRCG